LSQAISHFFVFGNSVRFCRIPFIISINFNGVGTRTASHQAVLETPLAELPHSANFRPGRDSPTIARRFNAGVPATATSPAGTADRMPHGFAVAIFYCRQSDRPCGTWNVFGFNPALKRRAILNGSGGTKNPATPRTGLRSQ
jgi:hypothetical protein